MSFLHGLENKAYAHAKEEFIKKLIDEGVIDVKGIGVFTYDDKINRIYYAEDHQTLETIQTGRVKRNYQ